MAIKNQIKTVLLLGILTGILLVIGQFLGGNTGLIIALVISLALNFSMYWFSDRIALFIYRAKPADPKQYRELHNLVADTAKLSGIPKPRVYIIPSEQSNAFACGRNPKNASVAFTQGILKLMTKEELQGVTAHEISHVKNRDVLISTIAASIAGIISYIAMMVRWGPLFNSDEEGVNPLYYIIIGILTPIIAMLIQLAISRSREYFADESGAKLLRNSEGLATALQKLESDTKKTPMRLGSPSTAHLFIANPFRGQFLMSLLSTHPNTQSRVERLRKIKF
ncbi:zinc metalloprotease HtpX [Candidatus Woesearchaeota archaeon]|nr:zinc metalloprotease HtpX [Candidatus Woesearchaeota archaeon]